MEHKVVAVTPAINTEYSHTESRLVCACGYVERMTNNQDMMDHIEEENNKEN